jgi:pimeloyl-ACP methyl ester carboxylesterase
MPARKTTPHIFSRAAQAAPAARVGDISVAWSEHGTGEPLLLVSGYGTTRLIWEEATLDRLAERHRVIVFDSRGMGDTEAGSREFSIRQFAEDAFGLLQALGIENCSVLGWSMGSLIAQELALAHPERVDLLVLYASYADWSTPPSLETIELLSDISGTPEERGMRWVQTLFPPQWLSTHGKRVGEIFSRPLGNIPGESVKRQQDAIQGWGGSAGRLPGLQAPTLLLCGREDVLVPPENSLLMAGLLPHATLRILPGMGHGLMFQDPETFCSIVSGFLEEK